MRDRWAVVGLLTLALVMGAGAAGADPICTGELIYLTDSGFPSCHASSIVELSNGDLLCAWFTGAHEGSGDVVIRYSRKAAGSDSWTTPTTLVDTPDKPENNPVLWQDPTGKVWCWYSYPTSGSDLTTSQLNYLTSSDNGASWSTPANMMAELGYLARCHPIIASNGNWVLPIYDERDWTGVMLISTNQGANWYMSNRIDTGGGYKASTIQPSIVERSDTVLRALCRMSPKPTNIYESYSYDYGWNWTTPAATSLPNPNASIDQCRLANGHVVLIFNNSGTSRTPLTAALSTDEGATWTAMRDLETYAGEYSYPSVIQTADGLIHAVYTYRRTHVKHVVFNEEWLATGEPAPFNQITNAANGVIVVDDTYWTTGEEKAAEMLQEEVAARTGLTFSIIDHSAFTPSSSVTAFLVGHAGGHAVIDALRPGLSLSAEGFHLETLTDSGNPYVVCAGADTRGALYAVGKALRKAEYASGTLTVPTLDEEQAPEFPIRGHQLGYRTTNNTCDSWDINAYEQYIRDLIIFGVNSIELIPPRTSSDPGQGPLMPVNPWDMTLALCDLLDDYDLEVWMWAPANVNLYDAGQRAAMLADRDALFAACSRIDAIFVPGGDPGSNAPDIFMDFVEDLATSLRTYHPSAEMWVSHQGWEITDRNTFYTLLQTTTPSWLDGVVYGPWTRDTLANTRAQVPVQYQVRRYPDITHCLRSQYPAVEWDHAFALTLGREPINPRPTQEAQICTGLDDYADGAITYSDGVNDDINKMIWSARLWDSTVSVDETLEDYNRYFFSNEFGVGMVQALLDLEANWQGEVTANTGIDATLAAWQAMEAVAGAGTLASNWRFQQGLFRAYYDAYVKARRTEAAQLEQDAYDDLAQAGTVGADTAIDTALATLALQDGSGTGAGLRTRVEDLGDDLNTSIGMQLSVPLHGASGSERGAVLDFLDEYLNNRLWLEDVLPAIKALGNETDKLAYITWAANWEQAGADGAFDDGGNGARGGEPHLVHAKTWAQDPGYVESAQDEFDFSKYPDGRLSWRRQAQTLYDTPLQMQFDGLDTAADYTLRVTYAGRFNATITLDADGSSIHGGTAATNPPTQYDYAIPQALTADGELTLTWQRVSESSGRGPQVAEVWLMRSAPQIVINDGDAYTGSATLDLDLWGINPREMQFQYPGSGGWTSWEPFSYSKQVTVTASDGVVQVDYRVRYLDMSVSGTYSDTITLDQTGPVVAITQPTDDEDVRGSYEVQATANDALVSVDRVEFYLDGEGTPRHTDSTAPYTWTWDTTAESEGSHTVTAKGYDTLDNMDQASVTAWVDNVTFDDVPQTASYWCHVEAMYRQGIITAASYDPETHERLFAPNDLVTRKTMAQFLCRAAGKDELDSPTPSFNDVSSDHPYYGWIERLADSDSWYDGGNPCLEPPTQGCGPNPPYPAPSYCPDTVVNRAQMAVFICRATGKCPWSNPVPTFGDVPPSASYYGHVERLADPGSWTPPTEAPTQGCGGGNYCPESECTRAMMAVFLARAWGHMCDDTVPEVTIDQPSQGAGLTDTVQFQVTAATADSVEFWVNNESEPRYTDDATPFTWDCDTRMIPGGAATITVRAYDSSAKAGLATVNVSIDNVIFSDVPHTASYWKHVEAAWRAGIMTDRGDVTFYPDDPVYRKNMAEFLCKAAGRSELASPTPRFDDVPETHPYYGWVERLADTDSWYDMGNSCLGPPTAGCAPSLFCPDNNVTRAQMAVFIDRAKGKCELDSPTPTFGDVPKSVSYYGFVERLADADSWPAPTEPPTQGCGGGNFCPLDNVTRCQMAVFLARAYGLPL